MSAPAAPNRTQRWREKSVRYRPAGEPGFDPDRYEVAEIAKAPARRFVTTHHYTGGYPQTRFQFGLFDTQADNGPELVGVISLGNGSHANALTNPFPSLVPSLNRPNTSTQRYWSRAAGQVGRTEPSTLYPLG